MSDLQIRHFEGTHRLCSPEETLSRIIPVLEACGITRCADVTGLDDLDVPTYCAIRPRGLVLQTSNGKGATHAAAQVSALMEGIELDHAERPLPERLRQASLDELVLEGENAVAPESLPGRAESYWTPRFRLPWTQGTELNSNRSVWVPASLVYFGVEPCLFHTTSNGLASGNHAVEAQLHALLEAIERDAISRVFVDGKLRWKEYCRLIRNETVDDPVLLGILQKVEAAKNRVILARIENPLELHTFWALIVNESATSAVSTVNLGYGTHLNPVVAATRAVTEAAQSRLTFIHGSREDIMGKKVFRAEGIESSESYQFLRRVEPDLDWRQKPVFETEHLENLQECLHAVLGCLRKAGHSTVYRFDLARPEIGVPVERIVIPSLRFNPRLF